VSPASDEIFFGVEVRGRNKRKPVVLTHWTYRGQVSIGTRQGNHRYGEIKITYIPQSTMNRTGVYRAAICQSVDGWPADWVKQRATTGYRLLTHKFSAENNMPLRNIIECLL
jgi:hypothetical protein